MKIQLLKYFTLFLGILLFATACDSGPKVIESETAESNTPTQTDIPVFNDVPSLQQTVSDEHKVVVEEVLNTDKYSYLNVTEGDEKFWVAISKRDVQIGDTYYYKGGLLKKNFFSQEFNRTFETVYLVSNIWKNPAGAGGSALDEALGNVNHGGGTPDLEVKNIERAEGAVALADLLANKEKYNNQTVKVTGKVIKVNPMIMSRNWLHLADGSGKDLDLTITTLESVPLGAVVSLEGIIALDKDFGAGYRYDIIMEGAVLK